MSLASSVRKIRVLSESVVSRIAAGEVVERPAAVVKELIDNSIDAGSTRITVEVTDGGRGIIRVTDDGEGMSWADARLAFQRHATSKLRTEEDLSSIGTMGFRGEALPSIASVSKVRVLTACRNETVGTRLVITGGVFIEQGEAAAAPGTQIEVSDLFFNTPARKKFLKSTATEFSHICQVVQQAALAWPGIQFRLKHNSHDVLDYPSVASYQDRILQVYGMRLVEQMTEAREQGPGILVEGLVLKAVHIRTGRSPQELFVNRRPIRNSTILHAIYDGYGVSLAKGHHPLFVLFLDVDPARVDVNVHPTKREVRFADQVMIHQTVRQAIREAVNGDHLKLAIKSVGQGLSHQQQPPMESHAVKGWGHTVVNEVMADPSTIQEQPTPQLLHERDFVRASTACEAVPSYLVSAGCDYTVTPLGQISQTFLVAQVASELQVIDQHTAHERVLFEQLWRAWSGQAVPTQPLLVPEPIEVPPSGTVLLRQYLPDLEKLGLEVEPFGATAFVVRSVPALLGQVGHIDLVGLIQDVVDDLTQCHSASSLESRIRPVIASLACHSAVRAGRAMALPEIKQLIEDWIREGLPTTCPHGRRIALRLPTDELEKIFGRI